MKLTDMVPLDQDVEQARAKDPQFREQWDSTAYARAVAIQVVQYRADHGLTQTQLADMTGMTQPAIARLESGTYKPTLKTLERVSAATGIEFTVNVAGGVSHLERPAT